MASYNVASISCPLCDLQSKQEARFYSHLLAVHSVDDPEACYVQHVLGGIRPTCQCSSGCPEPILWKGWKKGYTSRYVRGHNARIDTVFGRPEFVEQSVKKRLQGFAEGRYRVWNDGLTKETDDRVAAMSVKIGGTLNEGYASGRLVDWRVGNPEKAADAARKISMTQKDRYARRAIVTWNDGLTKETNASLLRASQKISLRYERRSAGRRMTIDELVERAMKLDGIELLTPTDDYRNMYSQKLLFRCLMCGVEIAKTFSAMETTPRCFACHPKTSLGQLQLFEFIGSLVSGVLLDDRTIIAPKELDVVVPGKLAVEYDGLWWHSEMFLGKKHAVEKLRACDAVNLPLFKVFEDEWRDKRPIVEGMIRHRLGLVEERVGARQCSIEELDSSTYRRFFDTNHLDGNRRATYALGLLNQGRIVAAMSFKRSTRTKHKGVFEVVRFATMTGIAVPGALSRLVHEHRGRVGESEPLMTYVDRRLGTSQGYVASGFKRTVDTVSRFWWTDFRHRFDRFRFRANAASGLTEAQVAEEAGVTKIWGCPNVVLSL